MIVEQQRQYLPVEALDYVVQRLPRDTMRAHEPRQGGIIFGLVAKGIGLTARRQHRDAPGTGVPRYRCQCVLAHGSEKRVWLVEIFQG